LPCEATAAEYLALWRIRFWRERKESYIRHLPDVSDDAILVSLADKLDNGRAMLRDFRAHGGELWQRFTVQDRQLHLWYYRSLLEVYTDRVDNWMVDELRRVIDALERAIRQSA
jgi:hypothetical protein